MITIQDIIDTCDNKLDTAAQEWPTASPLEGIVLMSEAQQLLEIRACASANMHDESGGFVFAGFDEFLNRAVATGVFGNESVALLNVTAAWRSFYMVGRSNQGLANLAERMKGYPMAEISNGFHTSTLAEFYHSWPALSQSLMKDLLKSPAHGAERVQKGILPTARMRLGTAGHLAVLEPEKFEQLAIEVDTLKPASQANTWAKAEQKLVDDWQEQVKEDNADPDWLLPGVRPVPLPPGYFNAFRRMADVVRKDPIAGPLLEAKDRHVEASVKWDENGTPCKARPDLVVPGFGTADLKFTEYWQRDDFEYQVDKMFWHLQSAWYQRGLMSVGAFSYRPGFAHICVSPIDSGPTMVRCYELDAASTEAGWCRCLEALGAYRAMQRQEWDYRKPTQIEMVTLRPYSYDPNETPSVPLDAVLEAV